MLKLILFKYYDIIFSCILVINKNVSHSTCVIFVCKEHSASKTFPKFDSDLGWVRWNPGVNGCRIKAEVPLDLQGADIPIVQAVLAINYGWWLSSVLNDLWCPNIQNLHLICLTDQATYNHCKKCRIHIIMCESFLQ